jgi:dihydropyrimidine dehydrogenase (NAD+) subunit PreT
LRQLRFENPLGAAETVLDNNPLGGICGTVCPVSQLCEKCCTRNALDGPVKIGAVQRYLHDFGIQEKLALPPVPPPSGHKSAIVGAGPAGLSAARELARRGSEVTVFETRSSPGGALTHALSPFRVDHAMVQQEVGRISDMGVRFQHGVDATVTDAETLRAQGFDAVFVSTGLQTSKSLPGFTYNVNCLSALAFLESANASMEAAAATYRGKNITVVGGGSVAMDCAVTAKGLGAAHVHVVALESLLDLPADVEEIELARSMGVQIHGETRVVDMQLERERGGGIVLVAPAAGTDDSEASGAIESSFVIVAVGQTLDSTAKELAAGMDCTEDVSHGTKGHTCSCDALVLERSTPAAAPQSMRGIYFGGDMVRTGGDTVVRAVADGKRAAAAMLPTTPVAIRKELSLGLEYCGIMFENPFCLSSSPVTNTADMIAMAYDHGWGGSYFKTLNREDKFAVSHPSPRLSSVHSGLRHNLGVGIQNVEQISDRPLADNLRDISWLRKHYPTKITGVSIMGYSEDDWAYLAAAAEVSRWACSNLP